MNTRLMNIRFHHASLLVPIIMLCGSAAFAQSSGTVRDLTTMAPAANAAAAVGSITDGGLQPVTVGQAAYITGGIGESERLQLESVKNQYNLHVLSAGVDGALQGDTRITITDQKGTEIINANAGPLFYAKLPKGTYVLNATQAGRVKKQNVTVSDQKSSNVHLSWK
jgi:hypothetical protein